MIGNQSLGGGDESTSQIREFSQHSQRTDDKNWNATGCRMRLQRSVLVASVRADQSIDASQLGAGNLEPGCSRWHSFRQRRNPSGERLGSIGQSIQWILG